MQDHQVGNFSREMETAESVNLNIGEQKSPKLNHEGGGERGRRRNIQEVRDHMQHCHIQVIRIPGRGE